MNWLAFLQISKNGTNCVQNVHMAYMIELNEIIGNLSCRVRIILYTDSSILLRCMLKNPPSTNTEHIQTAAQPPISKTCIQSKSIILINFEFHINNSTQNTIQITITLDKSSPWLILTYRTVTTKYRCHPPSTCSNLCL